MSKKRNVGPGSKNILFNFDKIYKYGKTIEEEYLHGLYIKDTEWLLELLAETKNQSYHELPSLIPMTPSASRKHPHFILSADSSFSNFTKDKKQKLESSHFDTENLDTIMEESDSSLYIPPTISKQALVASTPHVVNKSTFPSSVLDSLGPINKVAFDIFQSGGNVARPRIIKPIYNSELTDKPIISKSTDSASNGKKKKAATGSVSIRIPLKLANVSAINSSAASNSTRSKLELAADRVLRDRTERAKEQKAKTERKLAEAKIRRENIAKEKEMNRLKKVKNSLNSSTRQDTSEIGRKLVFSDMTKNSRIKTGYNVSSIANTPSKLQSVPIRVISNGQTRIKSSLKNTETEICNSVNKERENAENLPPIQEIDTPSSFTSVGRTFTLSQSQTSKLSTEKSLPCSKSTVSNYEITPQRPVASHPPPKVPPLTSTYKRNEANTEYTCYGIGDLSSEDDTDDEDNPKKPIPDWAKDVPLWRTICRQFDSCIDAERIFGRFKPLDLNTMFRDNRIVLRNRTSSAIWDSPMYRSKFPHKKL